MYIRFSTLLPIAALVASAVAAPNALAVRQDSCSSNSTSTNSTSTTTSECNTGSILCCESMSSASDPTTASILGLLGLVVADVLGLVGLGCSPSSVGVGSGATCSQQPVCCNGDTFIGLITIGCSPITIVL